MKRRINLFARLACLALIILCARVALAEEALSLSTGQTLYVPAYSHIYAGNREQAFLLTVTLSVRNVDAKYPITITRVEYYDTKGKLLKKYLDHAITLGPFASTRYIVPQSERAGGSGANFIVAWQSDKGINPPIVEAIMIGAESLRGVSFTSRGQVITTSN